MSDFTEAREQAEAWLDIEGVEGIAEGESGGEPCITVFVSFKEVAEKIPPTCHGIKVVIEYTDQFVAMPVRPENSPEGEG